MNEVNYSVILEDCAKIAKDRQEQYGLAQDSIKLANNILFETFGVKITDKELCYAIISIKLSRERFNKKEDNIKDCVNYLAISLLCK